MRDLVYNLIYGHLREKRIHLPPEIEQCEISDMPKLSLCPTERLVVLCRLNMTRHNRLLALRLWKELLHPRLDEVWIRHFRASTCVYGDVVTSHHG